MFKTLESIESIIRHKKDKIRVVDDGSNDGSSYNSDFDKICLPNFYWDFIQDFNKIAVSLTPMLGMGSLTNSLTSMTQILVEYDKVNDGGSRSCDFNVTFQVLC